MNKAIPLFLFILSVFAMAHTAGAQVVLNENFEECTNNAIPVLWSKTAPYTWQTTSGQCEFGGGRFSGNPVGSKYACVNDYVNNVNNTNSVLRTHSFSLAGMSNPYLCFEYYYDQSPAEEFSIQISTDMGNTWSTLWALLLPNPSWQHDGWKHWEISLAPYVGQNNVRLGFKYSDAGKWARGAGIDGIKVYERRTDDAAIDFIKMGSYFGNGDQVTFYCRNMGTSVLTSLDAKYSINSAQAVTEKMSGLNIQPGMAAFISFSKLASGIISSNLKSNIQVTIENVNGVIDVNTGDNTANAAFTGASKTVTRNGLMEEFGNRGCPSCIEFSNIFDPVAIAAKVNSPATHMNVVKYQLNFPATDLSFNYDAATRQYFYDVDAITKHFNNGRVGGTAQSSIQPELEKEMDETRSGKAVVDISGSYSTTGNTVTAHVKLKPFITCTGDYKIYMAVTERHYYDSGAYSYQKHFYNVMRRMLPSADGYAQTTFTDAQEIDLSETYTFTIGNVYDYSYNLWGSADNTDLVVWVQDMNTKEVLQSLSIPANTVVLPSSVQHMTGSFEKAVLSPNPASHMANLSIVTNKPGEGELHIYTMDGKIAWQQHTILPAGACTISISLDDLPQGIYMVKLQTASGALMQRLSVVR